MPANPKPKLHAWLAQQGIASRRQVEEMITQGKVRVNQQLAHVGQRISPGQDQVEIKSTNGKWQAVGRLSSNELKFFLVYKPVGFISTTSDELKRKTVISLLPQSEQARIYPVGRLDAESEGLMLLTNDGELTQRLTHPSHNVAKTYEVLLAGRPSYRALQLLERGVKLKDGLIKPDAFEIMSHEDGNTWLRITIHSGKNRIVRRMMQRIGYDVLRLIRTQMGPFQIKQLEGRQLKELSLTEVEQLTRSLAS